jgi:hypothetical protein
LGVDLKCVGREGSPTRVVKIEKPSAARKGRQADLGKVGPKRAAREFVNFLGEKNLL